VGGIAVVAEDTAVAMAVTAAGEEGTSFFNSAKLQGAARKSRRFFISASSLAPPVCSLTKLCGSKAPSGLGIG